MSSKKITKIITVLSFYLVIFALTWADRISKSFFLDHSYVEITDWFKIELAFNLGSAFGLQIPIILTSIVGAIIGILFLVSPLSARFYRQRKVEMFLWGVVAAGVWGNTVDRIFLGHVIDFIKVGAWPNFNFADIYLTVGIIALLVISIFFDKSKSNPV